MASGRVLTHAGDQDAEVVDAAAVLGWARASASLVQAAAGAPADPPDVADDLIVSTRRWYHLLRPVEAPDGATLLLYVRLQRGRANLALARHEIATAQVAAGVAALVGGPGMDVGAGLPTSRAAGAPGAAGLPQRTRTTYRAASDPRPDNGSGDFAAHRGAPVIPAQARPRPSPPTAMAGRSAPAHRGGPVSPLGVPVRAASVTTPDTGPDAAPAVEPSPASPVRHPGAGAAPGTAASPGGTGERLGDGAGAMLPRRTAAVPPPPPAPAPRPRPSAPGAEGAWSQDMSTMKRLLAGLRRLV